MRTPKPRRQLATSRCVVLDLLISILIPSEPGSPPWCQASGTMFSFTPHQPLGIHTYQDLTQEAVAPSSSLLRVRTDPSPSPSCRCRNIYLSHPRTQFLDSLMTKPSRGLPRLIFRVSPAEPSDLRNSTSPPSHLRTGSVSQPHLVLQAQERV